MDFNTMNSPQRFERPIILSPPPLDGSAQSAVLRQHSVGFNLQQEFEALNENLDLDLKEIAPDVAASSATSSSSTSVPLTKSASSKLMAPASKYGFSHDLLGSMSNSSALFGQSSALFDRPQSVNEFPALAQAASANQPSQGQSSAQHPGGAGSSFYPDLIAFTSWIENLAPQDSLKMVDFLCHNLPIDILLTFKSKLDSHLTSYHHGAPQSGYGLAPYQSDLFSEFDAMNLDSPSSQKPALHQPKPKPNFRSQYLFADVSKHRPKSADPSLNQSAQQSQLMSQTLNMPANPLERARSPTSHLFEKTNFLQLAAASSTSPMTGYLNPVVTSPQTQSAQADEDLSAHTALKLGALATINQRVALDSNRKQQSQYYRHGFEESINRNANSSSVPLMMQRSGSTGLKTPIKSNLTMKKSSPDHQKQRSMPPSTSPSSVSNSSMPLEVTNLELLSNIPAWLKLLRLHKYTDCLKDVPWQQLIELDNDALEDKGVIALGARRKLLKAFDVVKKAHNL